MDAGGSGGSGPPLGEAELAAQDYCYVTTTGRSSGRPHTIEIWFALHGDRAYLLSGGGERSDWVRNVRANPTVGLRIGDRDMLAKARVVEDPEEDALARRGGRHQNGTDDAGGPVDG